MKKRLSVLLAMLLFSLPWAVAFAQKATVINPDTLDRKVVEVGDPNAFYGGYELETSYGYVEPKEDTLGFSVVTDYQTTLSSSMTASQSTLPVSKVTTKDGHTLTMNDLGTKVFFIIEPGASKQEIVMCTGLTGTTWTTCTRGLAFYGTSTASVSANRKTHNSGSTIVMSNVHYVYDEQVDKDSDETIAGIKTFTSSPIVPSPTTDMQVSTKAYVDNVAAEGGANASTITKGISKLSTDPAISTNPIAVGTNDTRMPTQGENDALVGTSGTPSSVNKYVTDDDTTGTGDILRSSEILLEWSDGQDGDVTITTAISLTKDMNYKDLVIESGGSLNANGYKIYAQSVDIQSGGSIDMSGNAGGNGVDGNGTSAGGGGTAGAVVHSSGSLISSAIGKAGGDGGNTDYSLGDDGVDGDTRDYVIGVIGANGGKGGVSKDTSSSRAGGAKGGAGVITSPDVSIISLETAKKLSSVDLSDDGIIKQLQNTSGSGSGGGGGSNGSYGGGGGGGSASSGGFCYIVAKTFNLSGDINIKGANGGNGGIGDDANGNYTAGGGGGGAGGSSGGVLVLVSETITGDGNINLNGGDGGNGGNGGFMGSNGSSSQYSGSGGDGGNGGNGGNFYKIFKTDSSTITVLLTAGSGGTKGLKGVAGGASLDGDDGADGTAGTIGTITSININ